MKDGRMISVLYEAVSMEMKTSNCHFKVPISMSLNVHGIIQLPTSHGLPKARLLPTLLMQCLVNLFFIYLLTYFFIYLGTCLSTYSFITLFVN